MMLLKHLAFGTLLLLSIAGCASTPDALVFLTHGTDESAGGDPAYIITTPSATYYLEKTGGGLSSMLDRDGVDWLGFHKAPGSAHKGEYRGFPNAVHRQDGNYFHAMNAGTDPASSNVDIQTPDHVRITFTSGNEQWVGHYDFYPDRLGFTMSEVSEGYRYWVQYEGVPGGDMEDSDYRLSSAEVEPRSVREAYEGDLPGPEWMAFGDADAPRVLFMLHHQDDPHPDDYASRPDMTVFAFGRRGKDKFLSSPSRFSIGFVEATDHASVDDAMHRILATTPR